MNAPAKNKSATVRDALVADILAGRYPDGEALPTEANLCERYEVSRVTVRKALETLKQSGILNSIRGSGTKVTLRRDARKGDLAIVAVAAPIYEPFFAQFFGHFQSTADDHGTTVLFKQESAKTDMSDPAFYRALIERGIRDFVLWPQHGFSRLDLLPRLRGIGANLVFFDHVLHTAYADCVTLDNVHAVETLFAQLLGKGCKQVHFLGWEDVPLSANFERESAFLRLAGADKEVTRITREGDVQAELKKMVERLKRRRALPDGFLCVSHDMGVALCSALRSLKLLSLPVAVVDEMPHYADLSVTSVAQPVRKLAERTYRCLQEQNCLLPPGNGNQRAKRGWKASRYMLRGTLGDR